MSERHLHEALLAERIPEEREAQERAWRLVRAAYLTSPPQLRPRRARARRGLQVAVAIGLVAVFIGPAGAAVRHWVRDAVAPGHQPSRPALTSLPASGSLLVDSAPGPWIVQADGSRRLLGPYGQSTWSPHGLFVAVTEGRQLSAVEPGGAVRWSLARPRPVRAPAWSPDGYRIAYLEGADLRVIAGDGTGDRRLARGVASVAPAWEPGPAQRLAYLRLKGTVRVLAPDSGRTAFQAPTGPGTFELDWSRSGSRLLVADRSGVRVLDRGGALLWRSPAPAGMRVRAASISPSGRAVAAVLGSRSGGQSELLVYGPDGRARRLFSGPGRFGEVLYSPDGAWLLLAWPSADQWLFLEPGGAHRVVAISDIAGQFDPGATSPPAFPAVAGWCCRAGPSGG